MQVAKGADARSAEKGEDMSDLIKRSDAIQIVKDCSFSFDDNYHEVNGFAAVKGLQNLPSAENKGEWIKHDEERDYCSVCKHIFKTRTLTKQDKWTTYVDDLGYNYCPNCGARMTDKDIDVPYKIASDQRDYDSTYEPTYNEQDGSM